ncbi:hypothetical protein ACFHW2_36570 [Actinomadura sp. LOL_016]
MPVVVGVAAGALVARFVRSRRASTADPAPEREGDGSPARS